MVSVPARLPRALHPGAWWLWSLGLATAASRTTNPLLLALVVAVAALVVVSRRTDAPWALAFRMYLLLGALVVLVRVVFRIVFVPPAPLAEQYPLFTLPRIPLPEWVVGFRLFGTVTAEHLLGGVYDGLRLATMLVCLGAANALANPRRLLKAVPGALYEVGTAVVVALSVAPQLVESVQRVLRARRLRSGSAPAGRLRRIRVLRSVVVPVLADALDRSLALAAAMDSRGYGRTGAVPRRALTGALVVSGLLGVCVGVYALLDATVPGYLGVPMLGVGLALAATGLVTGGRGVRKSVYRPDRWRPAELAVAACGLGAAAVLTVAGTGSAADAAALYPSLDPLSWPQVTVVPLLGVLLAAAPAWLAPPPPRSGPAAGHVETTSQRTEATR